MTLPSQPKSISKQERGIKIVPRISDHALLRYLERVAGLDIEELRKQVMTDHLRNAILMGARAVKSGGYIYEIGRDGTVITILPRTNGWSRYEHQHSRSRSERA